MNVVRNNIWGYQVFKGILDLRIVDTGSDTDTEWIAPDESITAGVKLEYFTGRKVFLDGAGASDDASPDEDSYINLPDTYVSAIEYFIKSKMASDPQAQEFYHKKYEIEAAKASESYTRLKPIVTLYPFAIR
jgi:hypothetical protein